MSLSTATLDTPTPDGELLRRYVVDHDEAAFELLVWRHWRLVFEVCRRVLRHREDTEDATQATFLVFARKAATVRTAIAGWLAQVAYRCALKLASNRRESAVDVTSQSVQDSTSPDSSEFADIDTELNHLPDRYRLPLVLCCLQGLSYDEAAAQLNVKRGTLSGRLSRAKALLRNRLVARGVAVPAAVFAVALAELPRGSAVTPEIIRTILTAASAPTIPNGCRASAVAHGVTRMMTLRAFARRSLAMFAVAVVALLAGGYTATLLADEPKKVLTADPPKAIHKTDQERVQGEWVFDSAETVGGTNGINQAWHSVVAFNGDKLNMTQYKGFDWKTTFKLDESQSPKQFDMTVNEQAKKMMGFKDGTIKGIYRLDGDAMEMCLAASPDDPRPTKFTTGPKLKQFRFTLKKKAKDFDPAKLKEFKVTVVDGDGRPVEGAVVSQDHAVYVAMGWHDITTDGITKRLFTESITSSAVPPLPATNQNGETTYDPSAGANSSFRPNGVLYVQHKKRKLVALEPISPARIMTGLTVTLRPEAKLSGKVVVKGGVEAGPTSVYLCAHNVMWILAHSSHKSEFEFVVPVGEYQLLARGKYLKEEVSRGENSYPTFSPTHAVAVGPEGKTLKLEVEPNKVGALRGKPAPELGDMAGWKGKEVKLDDLKEKVVLLKFFNASEMTDIVHSMPGLVELHNQYSDKGLVVIGVHYPAAFSEPVTNVKELDKRLEAIRTKEWPKGDIPFSIGMMKSQDAPAAKAYGLSAEPILIDKSGKVVGHFNPYQEADLERLHKLLESK